MTPLLRAFTLEANFMCANQVIVEYLIKLKYIYFQSFSHTLKEIKKKEYKKMMKKKKLMKEIYYMQN